MAVIKTITDLERIGDEAQKIARMAKLHRHRDRRQQPRMRDLTHVAELASAMLRQSLDAFARLDAAAALRVAISRTRRRRRIPRDPAPAHHLHDGRPAHHLRSLEILFIAKALERIGDHAKNIAEYVIYMVKGRDVRHTPLEDVERELLE